MKTLYRWLMVLGAIALISGAHAPLPTAIAPQQLVEQLGQPHTPLILDVRTPAEYAGGHVPGAVNIPVQELTEHLERLTADLQQPIVVYCEGGPRARRAAALLDQSGYDHLRLLTGHMAAWRAAGLPVEQAPQRVR